MDDSSRHETIAKSDPAILNYYRQFLIKGFDWHIKYYNSSEFVSEKY